MFFDWTYIYTDNFLVLGKEPGEHCWSNLKSEVVKKWANSLHIYTEILKDLDELWDQEASKDLEFHNDEAKGRINSDKHAEEVHKSIRH